MRPRARTIMTLVKSPGASSNRTEANMVMRGSSARESVGLLGRSIKVRQCVVHAVEANVSRYKAAGCFGVGLTFRGADLGSSPGRPTSTPRPSDGDPSSRRIRARAGLIVALYEAHPGISLHKLGAALAERGIYVTQNSLSRFLERHRISREIRPATRPSRSGLTWKRGSRHGSRPNSTSIWNRLFFFSRTAKPAVRGVEIGVGIASEAGACGASLTSAVESVAQVLPSGVIDPAKVASGPGLGPRGDAGYKAHGTPQPRAG
jgi:hypothetical protein